MAAALGTIMIHGMAGAGMPTDARWSPDRVWNGRVDDGGSVHCLGNGQLCVYEQGPDVIQVFGPPYSTTTIGRINLEAPGEVEVRSRRAWGSAIWEHRVLRDGEEIAVLTDYVDSELPCFVREVQASAPISFDVLLEPGLDLADTSGKVADAGAGGGRLVRTRIGTPLVPFGNYPVPFATYHQFAWQGDVQAEEAPAPLPQADENADEDTEEAQRFRLTFAPGKATLYIAGGPQVDEAIANACAALAAGPETMLARTHEEWRAFSAKGRDFEAELPQDLPMRERLIQVLDDVAVLNKAQQADEGGIMAGYPYHLGYVRDQYGTYRGIWALGHEQMSKDILDFYYNVFEKSGWIRNAQAFGIDNLFHIHENDDVEMTGYIMLQAFHYADRSGDEAFLERIYPLLEWAFEAQTKHIVRGMLPFNGDETYVAGGILPRATLNDGSAESTLLFIDSGERFLDYVAEKELWEAQRLEEARETVARVKAQYRDNFWRDGHLITNNPKRREEPEAWPPARHGVCESCIRVQWTMRTENNRYVCITCWDNEPPLPKAPTTVYDLLSVSMTPLYFRSPMFKPEELRPLVDEMYETFKRTGKMPSRPDAPGTVGYDYGFLLYAMTEVGHPEAEALYRKTLELADPTGAWSEYYLNHVPKGTRCRPWESAINVEAILHWIEQAYGK